MRNVLKLVLGTSTTEYSGGRHDVTITLIALVTESPSLFGGMQVILVNLNMQVSCF